MKNTNTLLSSGNLQPLAASSPGGLVGQADQKTSREESLNSWLVKGMLFCVLKCLQAGLLISFLFISVILLIH